MVRGDWDPALVVALIEAIPFGYATPSMAAGGSEGWREWIGIDHAYYVLAGIFDAVNQNTRATGNWKKKPPKFDQWPVPHRAKSEEEKKPTTVAELFKKFTAVGSKE